VKSPLAAQTAKGRTKSENARSRKLQSNLFILLP
jgi:hypothetical protein